MKIVVTGASGRTSRMLIRALLGRGIPAADLILVSRSPERPELVPLAAAGAHLRYGDFTDPASLEPAFAGGERLYLMPMNHPPAEVDEAAVKRAVVEIAARSRIRFIMYQSVYDADTSPMQADDLTTEQAIKASGMDWSILRMAWLAESLGRECKTYLLQGRIADYPWPSRHGFVTRLDIALAAATVLAGDGPARSTGAHHRKTYNLVGPIVTIDDVASVLAELSDRTVTVEPRSDKPDCPPTDLPRLIGRSGTSVLDLLRDNAEELLSGKPPAGGEVMFGFQWQARGQVERPLDLGLLMSRLYEASQRGDRGAAVKFGILLGENAARLPGWRATHPEWFWWETKGEDGRPQTKAKMGRRR